MGWIDMDMEESTKYTQSGNGRFLVYIMMEKLAQAGESVGCTPAPFHYI